MAFRVVRGKPIAVYYTDGVKCFRHFGRHRRPGLLSYRMSRYRLDERRLYSDERRYADRAKSSNSQLRSSSGRDLSLLKRLMFSDAPLGQDAQIKIAIELSSRFRKRECWSYLDFLDSKTYKLEQVSIINLRMLRIMHSTTSNRLRRSMRAVKSAEDSVALEFAEREYNQARKEWELTRAIGTALEKDAFHMVIAGLSALDTESHLFTSAYGDTISGSISTPAVNLPNPNSELRWLVDLFFEKESNPTARDRITRELAKTDFAKSIVQDIRKYSELFKYTPEKILLSLMALSDWYDPTNSICKIKDKSTYLGVNLNFVKNLLSYCHTEDQKFFFLAATVGIFSRWFSLLAHPSDEVGSGCIEDFYYGFIELSEMTSGRNRSILLLPLYKSAKNTGLIEFDGDPDSVFADVSMQTAEEWQDVVWNH